MADSDAIGYMMAAEAATEIVSQKLETLLSRPEWVGCRLMETLVKDAKEKLAMIQESFSTRDRQFKRTEWLRRLLQTMYAAEDILDKFPFKVTGRRHEAVHVATWPIATLVHKCKLWRDLSNLVKAMEKLCQDQYLRKREPASSSPHANDPWQRKKLGRLTTFWDLQASTKSVWPVAKKKEIMKLIETDEGSRGVHNILILGEKGTGKTFLARCVFREAMYVGFESRAWVHVSASMDPREFLFEILKQVDKLARDVKVMDLSEIMETLPKKLAERKKFLLVLDDAHPSSLQLFPELVMIMALATKGYIITTTQHRGLVGKISQSEHLIELGGLGSEEIQGMLARKLHRVPKAERLTDDEKCIIDRCCGLPLCISLLSGLLLNAREDERKALAKDGSMITLSGILQLSYHRLPAHLKPCFIYMALFPVASPIPTRRLVRLWLAEGLLDLHCYNRQGKTTGLPEDVGETFILELADRNLIDVVSWRADGSPKACQMVTSLYEMISRTVMSTGFLHIHPASKSNNRNDYDPTGQQQQLSFQPQDRARVRWLAEHMSIVTDSSRGCCPALNFNHIHSFLSFYTRRGMLTKDISKFLWKLTPKTNCSLLRVLDLEGVYKPSLQGVLHKLALLRYLGLRSTVLDSIPREVGDLHYLETLDIKHTNITSLPSSLWKGRNLRHLHLNWFSIDLKKILKACSKNVMALTQLQTLIGLVIGEVNENSMRDHMNSLTTLTTLKLFVQCSGTDTSGAAGKSVANWISSRLTKLQSLTIGVIQEAKPAKEAEEAEPAKEADPRTSKIGPLPELSLAEHPNLFELYLVGQLRKPIWSQLLPVSLRVLTLSGSKLDIDMMPELGGLLKNLRTFRLLANSFLGTIMTFIKDGFPSLMILKIWKLPKLQKVIIEQGAMLHLKALEIRYLDGMKYVEGINECKELENICEVVKKGARGYFHQLKNETREEKILYKIEETQTPESTDDDYSSEDDTDASS